MSWNKKLFPVPFNKQHVILTVLLLLLGLLFLFSGYLPIPKLAVVCKSNETGPIWYDIALVFFIGVVFYSSVFFRVAGGLIVSFITTAAVFVALGPCHLFPGHKVIPYFWPVSFGVVSTFISILTGTLLNSRDRAEEARHTQERLTKQIVAAQENERLLLARELHDVVLQKAADAAHEVDDLFDNLPDDVMQGKLIRLRGHIDSIMNQTRQIIRGTRAPLLSEMGLLHSLKELVDNYADSAIKINLNIRGEERRLPWETETELFRITEQSLDNIKRHAQATTVEIILDFQPKKVNLRVVDNGTGFALLPMPELAKEKKYGLIDMWERARLVGGNVTIDTKPGNGTTIFCEVPA
jgi:signal transduction histidine kinase